MSGARGSADADRIELIGLQVWGWHGVFEHERRDGQPFVVDLVLELDTRPAAADDALAATVDYGALAEEVAAVVAGEAVDLIETLAERLAAVVLSHDPVDAVEVTVHKPAAPVPVPFADVRVRIRRDRENPPVPTARAQARPLFGPGATPTGEISLWDEPAASAESTVPPVVVGDVLDVAPPRPARVVLALGANVGDARATLRSAIEELARVPGLEITGVSPLARTAPVGGVEQPDFLNAVVTGLSGLAPRALLRACQEVEARHGRTRDVHWGPRTLDIDIVTFEGVAAATDDLEIPHPRAHQRAFVLQPWSELDPEAVLPGLGGGPVAALAATAPDREGVRWLALDWLGPEGEDS